MSKLTRYRIVNANDQPVSADNPNAADPGTITRRSFLHRLSVAGIATAGAGGLVSLLAGCGGGGGGGNSGGNNGGGTNPGGDGSGGFVPIPPATSLTGQILYSAHGTFGGLAGAVVTLQGAGLSATTDGGGYYLVSNVPPGTYTVTVTGPNHSVTGGVGYQPVSAVLSIGPGPTNFSAVLIPNGPSTTVNTVTPLVLRADANYTDEGFSVFPFLYFPAGTSTYDATVSIESVSPLDFAQFANLGPGAIPCIPITPKVIVSIGGTGNADLSDGNLPTGVNAPYMQIPLLISPLLPGTIDVMVGPVGSTAVPTTLPGKGTILADGQTLQVFLRDIPNSLRMAGGGFYIEILVCLGPGSLTENVGSPFTSPSFQVAYVINCGVPNPAKWEAYTYTQWVFNATLTVNGSPANLSKPLQDILRQAVGAPLGDSQYFYGYLPANSQGTVTQYAYPSTFTLSGSGSITGGPNASFVLNATGSFDTYRPNLAFTTCSVTGATGGPI